MAERLDVCELFFLSMSTSCFQLELTETPVPRTPLSTTQLSQFSAYAASPTTPTHSQFSAHLGTPSNPKRPHHELESDENHYPQAADKKRRYTPRRNNQEKLRDALKGIDNTGWTFGEFLYHVFQIKDRASMFRTSVSPAGLL
jgi:hypothetical protein